MPWAPPPSPVPVGVPISSVRYCPAACFLAPTWLCMAGESLPAALCATKQRAMSLHYPQPQRGETVDINKLMAISLGPNGRASPGLWTKVVSFMIRHSVILYSKQNYRTVMFSLPEEGWLNIKDYYVKVFRMLLDSNKNIFLARTIKSLHVRYTDRRKAGGAG